MAQIAKSRRSERFVTLTLVIALHGALFLLVLLAGNPLGHISPKPGVMKVVSLDAEASVSTASPPPRLPSKVPVYTPQQLAFDFSDDVDPDALDAPIGGCAALEAVRNAVLADPAAVDSVINAPPAARSVADAVVIWNAGWSDAASSLEAPLGAARAAVERTLSEMESACLDEPIAGPRLMQIPAGDQRTMFLVFGSGNWNWREIMLSSETGPEEANELRPTPGLNLRQALDWLKGN